MTPIPQRDPHFDPTRRNVPTMASLVRPATTRTYDPPTYRPAPPIAPRHGSWEVLQLSDDGSTRSAMVGTFADCADRANAMGRHPSTAGRFVVVPVLAANVQAVAR